jgi:hypothetical protein
MASIDKEMDVVFEETDMSMNVEFGEVQTVNTGGVSFKTDKTLKLENGILSVNTTDEMEKDNTLPITSAGVYATVGNIEALLKTI